MDRKQSEIAEGIARHAHEGQKRRGGDPYITHPERVAKRCGKHSDAVVATAWLHDTIEDGGMDIMDLEGAGIAPGILEALVVLTKAVGTYDDYLARVRANPIARAVKIEDMLDNLMDRPTQVQIRKYCNGLIYLMEAE